MHPKRRPTACVVLLGLLVNLGGAPALLCQQHGAVPPVAHATTVVGREAWPVYAPTVVAVVPLHAADTMFAQARALARDLGFQFAVTTSATIIDVRSGAAYYLPSDVTRGFVLLSPGKQPDLIRGAVSAALLERRLRAYRDAQGPRNPAPAPITGKRGAAGPQ